MKISSGKHLTQSNVLILPLFVEEKTHKEAFSHLMPSTKTEIKSHLNKPYFKSKPGQIFTIHPEKEPVEHIILVGLGKEKHAKADTFRQAVAHGIRKSKQLKSTNLSLILAAEKYLQAAVEGAVLGNYNFDKYITNKKNLPPAIQSLKIVLEHQNSEIQKSIQKGQAIAEEISYIRDLANTPAADCTPADLAQEGHKIAKLSRNIKVTVFNKKQIQKMGMGLLYGVGQGSHNEPRLIVLEYKHKAKNKKPIMLVGKGITFDTGGLNLKPTNYIEDMKMDMTGAATVLAAFRLIARLNPDLHVVGIAACAENNVNHTATKPGDIHTAYNGKTVEITNTDAEGRLVLGDGLVVALDTTLTPDLVAEGLAREFVRHVQDLRKGAEFDIADHIRVYYTATPKLTGAIEQFREYIAGEILANEMKPGAAPAGTTTVEDAFDGEKVTIGIAKF